MIEQVFSFCVGGEDPLEEGMATHSSILAWRISIDRGVWQATLYKVSQSQTQLKWLSMHVSVCVSLSLCVCVSLFISQTHIGTHTVALSVAQLCPTLCNSMDFSTSKSFTISQSLLKLTSFESMMPSNHLIFCHTHRHMFFHTHKRLYAHKHSLSLSYTHTHIIIIIIIIVIIHKNVKVGKLRVGDTFPGSEQPLPWGDGTYTLPGALGHRRIQILIPSLNSFQGQKHGSLFLSSLYSLFPASFLSLLWGCPPLWHDPLGMQLWAESSYICCSLQICISRIPLPKRRQSVLCKECWRRTNDPYVRSGNGRSSCNAKDIYLGGKRRVMREGCPILPCDPELPTQWSFPQNPQGITRTPFLL